LWCEEGLGNTSCELILNTVIGAFYPTETTLIDESTPSLLDYILVPPYRVGEDSESVVVQGVSVTSENEQVIVTSPSEKNGTREVSFLTLTRVNPVQVTFSKYRDSNFLDWKSYNGIGVDAPAYTVSGYVSGGDNMRRKQAPFMFAYLGKTENGFTETDGELFVNNESSCQVQAHWDWHTTQSGNKWGRPFEAYRLSRFYMPIDSTDIYDVGESLVVTRNKLRGNGKVLSLKFSTSPGKDLRLYGWGLLVSMSEEI